MIFKFIKKIILLFLLFIIIFVFNNTVFASIDFTHNGINYNLPDIPSNIGSLQTYDKFLIVNRGGSVGVQLFYISTNYFDSNSSDSFNYFLYRLVDNKTAWGNSLESASSISTYANLFNSWEILLSNTDLYINGQLTFSSNYNQMVDLNLSVSDSNNTTGPVYIYSQFFDDNISNYSCDYSTDGQNWVSCYINTHNDIDTGFVGFRFYSTAFKNGAYHFRLYDKTLNEYSYATMNINNIILSYDNSHYYNDGVINPYLTYEYNYYNGEKQVFIFTQYLSLEQMENIKCEVSIDGQNWVNSEIQTHNDTYNNTVSYRFYYITKESGAYHFRFYNKTTGEYTYATMNIDMEKVNEYEEQTNAKNEVQESNNKIMDFFKQRFGFLLYPFELIYNILNKMLNINYSEPVIDIPTIYEPFSNNVLIEARSFNFNDLLTNSTLVNVHNIYLIIVDVIIIFGLVNLAKNKIMGVFEK